MGYQSEHLSSTRRICLLSLTGCNSRPLLTGGCLLSRKKNLVAERLGPLMRRIHARGPARPRAWNPGGGTLRCHRYYAKAQSKKIGRMYVHHVRKPTYTGLSRALVWMIHTAIFSILSCINQQSSWRSSCCCKITKRSTTGSLARTGSQAPAQGLLQRTVDLLNFSCHCIGVIPACQCLSNALAAFGYCCFAAIFDTCPHSDVVSLSKLLMQ